MCYQRLVSTNLCYLCKTNMTKYEGIALKFATNAKPHTQWQFNWSIKITFDPIFSYVIPILLGSDDGISILINF